MATLELGINKYKEGKFEEALGIFHKLLDQSPSNTVYITYRARVFSRLGNYELSLRDFDNLLSLAPFDCDAISDRAVVLHLMGSNKEALEELDRAQNLDPKNPYRYSSRAFLKDRMGDHLGAIEDYETAISLDPEDAVSLNNKGLVEEKLGYKQKSRQSFSKADKIVGYKPLSCGNTEQPSAKPDRKAVVDGGQGITFSMFARTLRSLFSDSSTRKDFLRFVSAKLKRS